MVEIEVKGWIAEGGGRLLHTPDGEFILFDLVENEYECGGIKEDMGTNRAWFHCCLEIKGGDPSRAGFIPEGGTLFYVTAEGYAMSREWLWDHPCLRPDQVINFMEAGKLITVKGEELLLNGEDGKMMRAIVVGQIYFDAFGVPKVPHTLKVPYHSDKYFIRELVH